MGGGEPLSHMHVHILKPLKMDGEDQNYDMVSQTNIHSSQQIGVKRKTRSLKRNMGVCYRVIIVNFTLKSNTFLSRMSPIKSHVSRITVPNLNLAKTIFEHSSQYSLRLKLILPLWP